MGFHSDQLGVFFLGPMMPGLFRKWSTFSKLAWKGSASVVGGLVAFRLPIDLLYFVVMLPLLGITMVGLALPSLPHSTELRWMVVARQLLFVWFHAAEG